MGRREANGGHCLIAWPRVCMPKELGGLGLHDLKRLGQAFKLWLWLAKTEPANPLDEFQMQVNPSVKALFSVAVVSLVGNGKSTQFWTDSWLKGRSVANLGPHVFAAVNKRRVKRRTVHEAMDQNFWIQDTLGALTVSALAEFLELWDLVTKVELQPDV